MNIPSPKNSVPLVKLSFRSEQGYALVEFALTMPMLVFLLMGIFDLGFAVYANNVISNSAREGARKAIVNTSDSAVRQQAVDTAIGLGLTTSSVSVVRGTSSTCQNAVGVSNGAVTVTVNYTYTAITPLIARVVGNGSFRLKKTAVMCVE